MFYDTVALNNRKNGRTEKKVFALKHIPTGLYFHSRVRKAWRTENNYYVAPYPMYRRAKSAFAYWLDNFEHPEDWTIEEGGVNSGT